jgi:hypothetical protein
MVLRPEEIDRAKVTPVIQHRGEDAHDFVRLAIDADGAANDIGLAPETSLPATLTKQNDAIVSGEIFSRQEIPAELRLESEHGKEIGGSAKGLDHLGRLAGFRKTRVPQRVGADLTVGLHLPLQIEKVGRRNTTLWILGRCPVEAVQLRAFGIGKWL